MTKLCALTIKEYKRFISRRNLVIWIITTALLMLTIQQGINQYKTLEQKENKFKKVQDCMFNQIPDYKSYSVEGFSILFLPSPAIIFIKNTIMPLDSTGKINTIVTLDMLNNLKGAALKPANQFVHLDFSFIVMFMGTMLALGFGIETMRYKDYLKSLSSGVSCLKLYIMIILTRFALLATAFILSTGMVMALISLNGILLSGRDAAGLAGFFLASLLLLLFFHALGIILGTIYYRQPPGLVIFFAWFLLLFGPIGIVNSLNEKSAPDIIKHYQTLLDKFESIMRFEKQALRRYGSFDRKNMETRRKVIEFYWNTTHKEKSTIEAQLGKQIAAYIDRYKDTAVLNPVTFYLLTGGEASSQGYENFIEFYRHLRDMEKKFVRFWIDRVYYHDPKIMVNFIRADENIYRGRACLPGNFFKGAGINAALCLLLLAINYLAFKNQMYRLTPDDIAALGHMNITLEEGQLKVYQVRGPGLAKFLFTFFSGQINRLMDKGFTGKIACAGPTPIPKKKKIDFCYLCGPGELPLDIKAADFLVFHARWASLPPPDRAGIMENEELKPLSNKYLDRLDSREVFLVQLALMDIMKGPVYLVDNIAAGLPLPASIRLKEKMEELKNRGAVVIYLTGEDLVETHAEEEVPCFREDGSWPEMVEFYKRKYAAGTKENPG